jgi:hypothetical protein
LVVEAFREEKEKRMQEESLEKDKDAGLKEGLKMSTRAIET